ncbi:MAG: TonB-dependent receptor [Edaphocola sp.]
MRIFTPLATLLLLALCVPVAFGQTGGLDISGTVTDNLGEALIGASVTLRDSANTTYVGGTTTDDNGKFKVGGLSRGHYSITVSYLGFGDWVKTLGLNANTNLGTVKLAKAKTNRLNEVKIVEQASPVRQNQDTTEYNAGSYKVNPDATTEDLVRKMPGIDLSSGTPKAQGETVAKVLVDGKPFFGDDANASLKNLPAEVVDKIQVYDEKSEQSQFTGFDDGNTSKTINIVTKANRRQGVFGKVYAGGGTDGTKDENNDLDKKYTLGANVNFFGGNRRISLISQSNNINQQNFSSQDLVGASGGSSGGRRSGGSSSSSMTGQSSGISRTSAIGLNYSDKWGTKIDVTGSYFFNDSKNTNKQESTQIYPTSGRVIDATSNTITNNTNHRFNLRFNYNIDSMNSIEFVPSLSFQKNNSNGNTTSQTFLDDVQNNESVSANGNDRTGSNLTSMFLYKHKFKKQGRTFSIWANGGYNSNDANSMLNALVTGEQSTGDTTDQQSVNTSNGWNINSNVNYTEPLSKKSFLQIQYGLRYQESQSDKRTYNFDYADGRYSDFDTALSNKFTTDYLTHKAGLTYRYSDTFYNFNLGVDFQSAQLNNDRVLPYASNINRTFANLLPNLRFQYRFSKKKNLRVFYRTSTDAPSVSQLQDVVNNSNPTQLTIGNPTLKQTYQHNLVARYNSTNAEHNTTFFAMLGGSVNQNYIGNSTDIVADTTTINGVVLPAGGQITKPENLSGQYSLNGFATFGKPLTGIKSNININASANLSATPGMINGNKNVANNTTLGIGAVLSSNISENIDFTLSSNGNYTVIRNTISTTSNSNFWNQSTRLGVNIIFWKGIVFNTELNHQYYLGLASGYNQNYLLWNMAVAKKLFKKRTGEIKLSVFDLLKQNNSISTSVTETYTQYTRNNVLQQYFLLTFTYNLRFFKGGASMKDAESQDRDRRPDGEMGPPPGGGGMPGGGGHPGM